MFGFSKIRFIVSEAFYSESVVKYGAPTKSAYNVDLVLRLGSRTNGSTG